MVPSHVGPPRFNGLLHATSRTLKRPGRGSQLALRNSSDGRPNKSLQRSADSVNFIRKTWRLVALRARPLNSSDRPQHKNKGKTLNGIVSQREVKCGRLILATGGLSSHSSATPRQPHSHVRSSSSGCRLLARRGSIPALDVFLKSNHECHS